VRIHFSYPKQPSTALPTWKVPPIESKDQSRESFAKPARPALGASSRVAAGILISRLTGLIRERVIGHYLGIDTVVADAFRAAIRIPNLLSNLFGEGVLSASFVTVYSKLRALEKTEEAEHLASAVFAILALVSSVLVLLGVLLTPALIDFIAPGFHGEKRALTIQIVRVLFPGTGLLVMGAWCLGVLNSHGRFLMSYLMPVLSNLAVIATGLAFGRSTYQDHLVVYLAWAVVVGAALQFFGQFPTVLRYLPRFRPIFEFHSTHVRSVLRNFGPIFVSRGVVQISAYVDSMIASLLPTGAVAALGYAQVISVLPISLFSMSVSAAELPALSSAIGSNEEIAAYLRKRLSAGLRRIAFFVVPSAMAFLLLGDVLAGALYVSGRFHYSGAIWVWSVLAGSAVGLLGSGLGRLYSSAFYALLDTRTPLRFALIRVVLTIGLGLLFALPLPHWLRIDPKWGVAGLTSSAGIAGWIEFLLLRRALAKRIGSTPLPGSFAAKLWFVAGVGATLGLVIKTLLGIDHPLLLASFVLPLYAFVYFAGTALLGIEESRATLSLVRRQLLRS
jgi:putative peptidoglycan lipid II flippase